MHNQSKSKLALKHNKSKRRKEMPKRHQDLKFYKTIKGYTDSSYIFSMRVLCFVTVVFYLRRQRTAVFLLKSNEPRTRMEAWLKLSYLCSAVGSFGGYVFLRGHVSPVLEHESKKHSQTVASHLALSLVCSFSSLQIMALFTDFVACMIFSVQVCHLEKSSAKDSVSGSSIE